MDNRGGAGGGSEAQPTQVSGTAQEIGGRLERSPLVGCETEGFTRKAPRAAALATGPAVGSTLATFTSLR